MTPYHSSCRAIIENGWGIYIILLIHHSGYKEFKGQVLNSSDLSSLVGGLRSNNLLHYSHMLTGQCMYTQTDRQTDNGILTDNNII